MLATFLTVVALASSANAVVPQWQTDYAKAYSLAATKHRPLAVFLAEGTKPEMTAANTKLLNDSYVVVFVDTNSDAGKKLAASFDMAKGLVISDSVADKQALRLTGTVAESDLTTALVRFADPTLVVTTTATTPAPVVVAPMMRPSCATGNCPFAR
ncbi:hypothetical protein BH11PLA2_BH11PLA2_19980 [soil metagenome]